MSVLKASQTVVAVLYALCFWIIVLALPPSAPAWPGWARLGIAVAGGLLVLVSAVGTITSLRGKNDARHIPALVCVALFGVLLLVVAAITQSKLELSDAVRLGVGVGGLAIAGLVYGMTRFDSIRAAVSIPAAVLVIGVATWPESSELFATDVRTEVIKWMGILLAANGVAEAAKQVGTARETNGQTGDLATTPT